MSYTEKTNEIFEALKGVPGLSFKRVANGFIPKIRVNKTAYVCFTSDGFDMPEAPAYVRVKCNIALFLSDKIEGYDRDADSFELGLKIVQVLINNGFVFIDDFSSQKGEDEIGMFAFFNIEGTLLLNVAS